MALDKLRYAIVEKSHRSRHVGAFYEAESSPEPAVMLSGRAFCNHVESECPFVAFLSEGKIVDRKEILVEGHVVVDILEAADGR